MMTLFERGCDRPMAVAILECMFHSSRMMLMLMITYDADDESSLIFAQLQFNDIDLWNN